MEINACYSALALCRQLILSSNSLNGSLPVGLSLCKSLAYGHSNCMRIVVDVETDGDGPHNTVWGVCARRSIDLSMNALNGTIPDALSTLHQLV